MTAAVNPKKLFSALTSPQVNLLLAVSLTITLVTGITSWMAGTEVSRIWTALHAVFGFMTLLLAPTTTRTSVRTGMNRKKDTRWISVMFGVCVLAAIIFGFLHSSGLWFGVGSRTSMYLHLVGGFFSIPLLIWHVWARPVNVRRVSMDRRVFLRGGLVAGVASVMVGVTEVAYEAADTAGADRRFTGSHEVASGNPAELPVVSWYNDKIVRRPRESWELSIDGQLQDLDQLCARAQPLDAVLDCTGGWWSNQTWDVVPLSEVLDTTSRSFRVTSDTGYSMLFATDDISNIYLGVGYGREPLAQGHGAPVRIIAPGRRGPWWIKWVVSI